MVPLLFLVGVGIVCARRPTDSAKLDTDLLHAARKGDTASVQHLLQHGAHIEAKNQGGQTALAVAAEFGHSDTVNLLLANGADPVAGELAPESALIINAARQANANKVELILERGADLKTKNEALFAVGESEPAVLEALPGAAQPAQTLPREEPYGTLKFPFTDPTDTARLLLEHGATLEAIEEEGDTPLIRAASFGGTNVVKVLLAKGANVDARDDRGMTALIAAACDCAIVDMPDTLDSVKLLLQKGANVNAKDKEGRTALMMAAGWGRADIMRLLLEKGASIDAKDFHGNTALLLLASGSAAPTAGATALLLSRGANLEVRNNDGAYPLDSLRFETGIR
jgi:ankyrin repeat protein